MRDIILVGCKDVNECVEGGYDWRCEELGEESRR